MLVNRVGLKLFNYFEIIDYLGALKRDLMLFDELFFDPAQFEINRNIADFLLRQKGLDADSVSLMSADIDFLVAQGALSEISYSDVELDETSQAEFDRIHSIGSELSKKALEGDDLNEVVVGERKLVTSNGMTSINYRNKLDLLCARNARMTSDAEVTISTPTLDQPAMFFDFEMEEAESALTNGYVMRLVEAAVPMPDDSVPIEQVLDFSLDPDTIKHRKLLRDWVVDMEAEDLGLYETATKMEALLADYEDHVKRAKIKFQRSTWETIIAIPFDILRGALTLNAQKAIQSVFSIGDAELALTKVEHEAPGRELAFISKVNAKFGNDQKQYQPRA